MEYKVGYIRVWSERWRWQEWTVGLIYKDNLHVYDSIDDSIRIFSGKESRNCFAINPNGLSTFSDKDSAEKCFKATIEDFKKKEKEEGKKEAIKEKARIIKAKKDSQRSFWFILILIILVSIGCGLAAVISNSIM